MAQWGQDIMTSLHQRLRGEDPASSQQVQETPAAESAAAQTAKESPNPDGEVNTTDTNSQEEHQSINRGDTPGSNGDPNTVPEKQSGQQEQEPGESSDGKDPVYLQNFSLDATHAEGDAEGDNSSLQTKPEQGSSSLLSELGDKLGIKAESVDDFVSAIKSQITQKKLTIPGIPEEVSDMVLDGTIGIEELATGELLYNFDELPDSTIYRNNLISLGFSEEKIEEIMDNVSDYEISVKAREIKNAENAKRQQAIQRLKSYRSEYQKTEEAKRQKLAEEHAKAFDQYKQSVSKALSSNEIKLAMTGQELSQNDRLAIQKVLTEDGMMRRLIWGSDNPTPEHLPNAIQSIATLIRRGDIAKMLKDQGRNEATKRFIDQASNVNLRQGGSYEPVTGGQSGPGWKQALHGGLKR